MSEYDYVSSGKLSLKGVSDHSIKKKKKKKKDKKKERKKVEKMYSGDDHDDEGHSGDGEKLETESREPSTSMPKRTNAEMAFLKAKEKRQTESLMEKASKTHKERIMDFNAHLDGLTEHFDIPKVSWTK